jgi:hypothetical protein
MESIQTKQAEILKRTTIRNISVRNMTSNNGNEVPNQFEIFTVDVDKDGTKHSAVYFQSYNTIIAAEIDGKVYLNDGSDGKYSWDCSRTTGKYRNQFLGETLKETRAKIKSGEYILTNLN